MSLIAYVSVSLPSFPTGHFSQTVYSFYVFLVSVIAYISVSVSLPSFLIDHFSQSIFPLSLSLPICLLSVLCLLSFHSFVFCLLSLSYLSIGHLFQSVFPYLCLFSLFLYQFLVSVALSNQIFLFLSMSLSHGYIFTLSSTTLSNLFLFHRSLDLSFHSVLHLSHS